MQDINTVVILGRLTRDVEVSYTSGGMAIGKLGIASNESRKTGGEWTEYANYFDVVIYGRMAEGLKQYLTRGKPVCIKGRLHQDRWERDGQKFSRVVVVADDVQLCGGQQRQQESRFDNYDNEPSRAPQEEQQEMSFSEDIPF